MLIRFAWWRFLRVMMGDRSFVKENIDDIDTYILVRGKAIDKLVDNLLRDGYIEEWPTNG